MERGSSAQQTPKVALTSVRLVWRPLWGLCGCPSSHSLLAKMHWSPNVPVNKCGSKQEYRCRPISGDHRGDACPVVLHVQWRTASSTLVSTGKILRVQIWVWSTSRPWKWNNRCSLGARPHRERSWGFTSFYTSLICFGEWKKSRAPQIPSATVFTVPRCGLAKAVSTGSVSKCLQCPSSCG